MPAMRPQEWLQSRVILRIFWNFPVDFSFNEVHERDDFWGKSLEQHPLIASLSAFSKLNYFFKNFFPVFRLAQLCTLGDCIIRSGISPILGVLLK